jgi:hypothetical protein
MRSTSAVLIALAMLAGACSDPAPDPVIATIDQMRVVAVSGDQTTQVPDIAPSQTIYATAGAALQAAPGEGWTPEPLVARVEATVASRGTGPSAVIPPGTLVHWQIPEVAGRLFGASTAVDDTAHVINRYAPGTRAGTYIAYAGRLVGGDIVTDAEWELVVEPGAVTRINWLCDPWGCDEVSVGEPFDLREYLAEPTDQYRNPVDLMAIPDSHVGWAWYGGPEDPEGPEGYGWMVTAPAAFPDPLYGLMLWIEGNYLGGRIFIEAQP